MLMAPSCQKILSSGAYSELWEGSALGCICHAWLCEQTTISVSFSTVEWTSAAIYFTFIPCSGRSTERL